MSNLEANILNTFRRHVPLCDHKSHFTETCLLILKVVHLLETSLALLERTFAKLPTPTLSPYLSTYRQPEDEKTGFAQRERSKMKITKGTHW